MAYSAKNITLPRELIKKMDGLVILPLGEYEKIKEDLEMMRSRMLAKMIQKARREAKKGEIVSLSEMEKKLNL